MNTQQPPFTYTYLESKLQEQLDAALSLISGLSKEDILQCNNECLKELVKRFVVAPPLLLLDSMDADKEVLEVVDITFERKTGQTNHSFFIPVEGEAHWLEEIRSQRTAIDDYPLAFLDRKRPRINIRLMLSPEDEEGTLKRKLDYRSKLVNQYADSVATKLIEFNNDLAEKMLAEFNKRKRAIVKAEKELENVGLSRVHNPEHEETALQIEQLLRSLKAYVTDTSSQQSSASRQAPSASPSKNSLTLAEQLYNKVKELIQNTKPLNEYTARIIVESSDDAIKEFGNTNQEKKVELRQWKAQAELVLPPSTIEELRKRAEGELIKRSYPKNAILRNVLLALVVLFVIVLGLFAIKKELWPKGQTAPPLPTATQPISQNPSKFTLASEDTAFALVSTIVGEYTVDDNFVGIQLERATFSLHQNSSPRQVLNLQIAIAHYSSEGRWEPVRYSEKIAINKMLQPTETLTLKPMPLTISRAGINDIENYWLVGIYTQEVDREGQPPAIGTSLAHSAEMLISRKPTDFKQ
jgi:hypothetical protein